MSPEQFHYDALESWFQESISQGREFLFDSKLFDVELRRLWEEYEGVPYEVSKLFLSPSLKVHRLILSPFPIRHRLCFLL